MATTVLLPLERDRFYLDYDGALTTVHHPDQVSSYTLDWGDRLASGETISTVTYTTQGPTITSTSNTSTTNTFTVSLTGDLEVKVTTSAGQTLITLMRFRSSGFSQREDYPLG